MAIVGIEEDLDNLYITRKAPTEEIQEIRNFCIDLYTYLFSERTGKKYRIDEKPCSSLFSPVIGEVVLLHSKECKAFFWKRFAKNLEWLTKSDKEVIRYMENIAKELIYYNRRIYAFVFLLASMILELTEFLYRYRLHTITYFSGMCLSYILEKYCKLEWFKFELCSLENIATEIRTKYLATGPYVAYMKLDRVPPEIFKSWKKLHNLKLSAKSSETTCAYLCANPVSQCTVFGEVITHEFSPDAMEDIIRRYPADEEKFANLKLAQNAVTFYSTEDEDIYCFKFEYDDSFLELIYEDVKLTERDELQKELKEYRRDTEYIEKIRELFTEIKFHDVEERCAKRDREYGKLPFRMIDNLIYLISTTDYSSDTSKSFLDFSESCKSLQSKSRYDQIRIICTLSRQASELFLRIVTNIINLCHKLNDVTEDTTLKQKAISVQNLMFELIFSYKDTEIYSFPAMSFPDDGFTGVTEKVIMCYKSLVYLHMKEATLNKKIIEQQNLKEKRPQNVEPDLEDSSGTSSGDVSQLKRELENMHTELANVKKL